MITIQPFFSDVIYRIAMKRFHFNWNKSKSRLYISKSIYHLGAFYSPAERRFL